jgi:uncharacterized protein (TIGR00251 family)
MSQLKLFDFPIPLPIRETNKGIELFVKVTPKAAKNRIGEIKEESTGHYALKIYVTSPPENNQANQAVIELIGKQFKIPKSLINIISGGTSRHKTLLLQNINSDDVTSVLKTL